MGRQSFFFVYSSLHSGQTNRVATSTDTSSHNINHRARACRKMTPKQSPPADSVFVQSVSDMTENFSHQVRQPQLKKIIIYIGHRQDGPIEQCTMRRNLNPVRIYRLIVPRSIAIWDSIRMSRHQVVERRVTFAEASLLRQSTHDNITSEF